MKPLGLSICVSIVIPAEGHAPLPSSTTSVYPPTMQAPDSRLERLLRTRMLRGALLVLIAIILAVNCVWAAQAVAAWRQGYAPSDGQQQLLLQRLNSTRLSVEVSRVGDEQGERSTYVVNAQLLGPDGGGGSGGGNQTTQAQQAAQAGAAASAAAAAEQLLDDPPSEQGRLRQQEQQQQEQQEQQGGQQQGSSFVAQLKGMGSALGLIDAHERGSVGKKGGPGSGKAAQPPSEPVADPSRSPPPSPLPPPSPPPHRCVAARLGVIPGAAARQPLLLIVLIHAVPANLLHSPRLPAAGRC